jgi:hypothetical protein
MSAPETYKSGNPDVKLINQTSSTSFTMTEILPSSTNATDIGKRPFDLFLDGVENQTGSDDAVAHALGNPDEPLTPTVSEREHLVFKLFLLSIPLYSLALC